MRVCYDASVVCAMSQMTQQPAHGRLATPLYEFQYVKLNALLDMCELVDPPRRLRVIRREDRRPTEGPLHGTCAHLGLTHLQGAKGQRGRATWGRWLQCHSAPCGTGIVNRPPFLSSADRRKRCRVLEQLQHSVGGTPFCVRIVGSACVRAPARSPTWRSAGPSSTAPARPCFVSGRWRLPWEC